MGCWLAQTSPVHGRSTAAALQACCKVRCRARDAESTASRPVCAPVFPYVEGCKSDSVLSQGVVWRVEGDSLPDQTSVKLLCTLCSEVSTSGFDALLCILHFQQGSRQVNHLTQNPCPLYLILLDPKHIPPPLLAPAGLWHPGLRWARILLGQFSQKAPRPLMFPLRTFPPTNLHPAPELPIPPFLSSQSSLVFHWPLLHTVGNSFWGVSVFAISLSSSGFSLMGFNGWMYERHWKSYLAHSKPCVA